MVNGPNRFQVADPTCIAIATGLVYLAAIPDAWSRRVIGYGVPSAARSMPGSRWLS